MWQKILTILKEILDIFGNWMRIREQDKIKKPIEKVSEQVDKSDIDELNKIWKNDLP